MYFTLEKNQIIDISNNLYIYFLLLILIIILFYTFIYFLLDYIKFKYTLSGRKLFKLIQQDVLYISTESYDKKK